MQVCVATSKEQDVHLFLCLYQDAINSRLFDLAEGVREHAKTNAATSSSGPSAWIMQALVQQRALYLDSLQGLFAMWLVAWAFSSISSSN